MADAVGESPKRQVAYFFTDNFTPLLAELNASLLISTYQAGKVVAVGTCEHELMVSFHDFERAMGMAVGPRQIAVGSRNHIWFLRPGGGVVRQIEPVGRYDACVVARRALVTGDIHGHELAWSGDQLWVVNTLFSCLCTLDEEHSFVPRWRPRFISSLAAEDRCHLNGMAMVDGQPMYVTALSETDTKDGWRPGKATGGCVLDVVSGETIVRGLSMPHCPRVYRGSLWVLDSGRGNLSVLHPADGRHQIVTQLRGYTRGLAFSGDYAFIGLSRIRETSAFGGIPISEHREELMCGVAVVHLPSGRLHGYLEFRSGIEEIFDVQIVPHVRCLAVCGPYPDRDDQPTIWIVPPPAADDSLAGPAST